MSFHSDNEEEVKKFLAQLLINTAWKDPDVREVNEQIRDAWLRYFKSQEKRIALKKLRS